MPENLHDGKGVFLYDHLHECLPNELGLISIESLAKGSSRAVLVDEGLFEIGVASQKR